MFAGKKEARFGKRGDLPRGPDRGRSLEEASGYKRESKARRLWGGKNRFWKN